MKVGVLSPMGSQEGSGGGGRTKVLMQEKLIEVAYTLRTY